MSADFPHSKIRAASLTCAFTLSILFIIFDLEAAFLFPWAVSLGETGWVGWGTMMLFLFELVIGFIYAWKVGALEWE